MPEQERCLVATHIDSEWNSPEAFKDNVEQYLEDEEFDYFVYESSGNHDEDSYDELADEIWENGPDSEEGIDDLLDRFNDFIHIGAYWRACHYVTWSRFVEKIYGREDDEEYTVSFPLAYIATDSAPVERHIVDDSYSLGWSPEAVHGEVARYMQAFPESAEEGTHFEYTLERDPETEIIWTIRNFDPSGMG